MSIRRQSCESCFKGRRKCSLEQPTCDRCKRNNKPCHYLYPPQRELALDSKLDEITPARGRIVDASASEYATLRDLLHAAAIHQAVHRAYAPQKSLGQLGILAPIASTDSWNWVFDQIRRCPVVFAAEASTIFIHQSSVGARPLRTAFAICAGCASLNDRNRRVLFQALDDAVADLVVPPAAPDSIATALAKLQATVLYQIIRLFYGDLEHRVAAERQEYLVRSYGLQLLRRAAAELGHEAPTWDRWLLAESIRRTVYIAFKLYTSYSISRYGSCSEIAAIRVLPVSTRTSSWASRDVYLQFSDPDDTLTYDEFSELWAGAPRRELDPFERFILVGCRKIEEVDSIYQGPMPPKGFVCQPPAVAASG